MTAGRGVVHSEMPVVTSGQLHGFQLWINLPAKASWPMPVTAHWAAVSDEEAVQPACSCAPS